MLQKLQKKSDKPKRPLVDRVIEIKQNRSSKGRSLFNWQLYNLIMSQVKSNSSYALSAIQFNSKSLNPLDSIQPAVITKIKREADNYANCAQRCSKIWQALAKNDIAGSHLTEKVLQVIFKEYQSDLYTFTRISSLKEFMKTFDQDRDGCLNPDQQIQIFSFIKERLQLVATNCLQIQSYIRFENLMKEVRMLEGLISRWQEILRNKVHSGQLHQYRREGENRVDQFCDKFDQQFEQMQKTMLERRENFEKQAFYESQALEERLGQNSEYLKIKPTNKIKELQVQEKLVSLEERVYEALDFRKELNELEIKEKLRVDRLMHEHAQHKRQNLKLKHQKQRRELQIKLQELQNKLIIKMKKQFDILKKKNNLHEIQIRRLQGLEKKWAAKKGVFEPQLKRTKKLQKQRNEVLEEYKKSMFGQQNKLEGLGDQQNPSSNTNKVNRFNAKAILEATTKFKLTNRSESQIPVNSKSVKVQSNTASKINAYITPHSTEKSYSLCKLYDNDLCPKETPPILSQNILLMEKSRKFNFAMSKLH